MPTQIKSDTARSSERELEREEDEGTEQGGGKEEEGGQEQKREEGETESERERKGLERHIEDRMQDLETNDDIAYHLAQISLTESASDSALDES